eukprot:TRINITY_DN14537_c0_g1_i1.p1 TRINITY_DN14537_c0_g1~~TRINITY_DN14537_c0_g1_i1.p1  ORF type:complete len:408 (+),score=34.55 TRINITY_DN14537_c0_g1_i1:38-1261(+)
MRLRTPARTDDEVEDCDSGWCCAGLPLGEGWGRVLSRVEASVAGARANKRNIEELKTAFSKGLKNVPWTKGRLLGSGSFGRVFEACIPVTGGRMAVKTVNLDHASSPGAEQTIVGEVQVMAELDHPNVIQYFWSERTDSHILIFMEYAKDGCLKDRIPVGGMKASEAAKVVRDVVVGLQYLHSRNIVHRDVKVANVLLSDGVAKLTDFGTAVRSATDSVHDSHCTAGTPAYMSPEVLCGGKGSKSADVWAVGCVMLELCTGAPPFAHVSTAPLGAVRYVAGLECGSPVDIGPETNFGSAEALDFTRICLTVDPTSRPDCATLLCSEYLSSELTMQRQLTRLMTACREHRKCSVATGSSSPVCVRRHSSRDPMTLVTLDDNWGAFSGWGTPALNNLPPAAKADDARMG